MFLPSDIFLNFPRRHNFFVIVESFENLRDLTNQLLKKADEECPFVGLVVGLGDRFHALNQ